jgi:hypothetical protein
MAAHIHREKTGKIVGNKLEPDVKRMRDIKFRHNEKTNRPFFPREKAGMRGYNYSSYEALIISSFRTNPGLDPGEDPESICYESVRY